MAARGVMVAILAVGVAVVGACSTPKHNPSAGAGPGTSAPRAPTTAVTTPAGPPWPLTGLPSADPTTFARPALSIKVDNAPSARPQAGLNQADLVTEELVEGGLTRFLATYQSQDAPVVGPIRSARLVDADLLRELGAGIFAYSGAAAGELGPIRATSGAVLLTPDAGDAGFHRDLSRPAPSNVYTSTAALYRAGLTRSAALTPPPSLWTFAPAVPTGAPGSVVTLRFSGSASAAWTWAPAAGSYARTEDGSAHLLAGGAQVSADDVVVLSVGVRPSGFVDAAHNPVPFVIVTGSGPCWVLRDGILEQGTWVRPNAGVPISLVGADGQPLTLRPGRVWLELLPTPAVPSIR